MRLFILILSLTFVFSNVIMADETEAPKETQKEESKVSLTDKSAYEKTLKEIELSIKQFDDRTTYKLEEFKKLPEKLQNLYMVFAGEALGHYLTDLKLTWDYNYKKKKHTLLDTDTAETAKPEDIEEYVKTLQNYRVLLAIKLEDFASKSLTDFSEEDQKWITDRISKYHIKQKLTTEKLKTEKSDE